MVGGSKVQISQEPNSLNLAANLVRDVWAVARQLDAKGFKFRVGRVVLDDHLALNDAGIPTIDLIDFDYPYWHKVDDLPKNCSADSLAEVGRVVTAWRPNPNAAPGVDRAPRGNHSSSALRVCSKRGVSNVERV